jgi:hypothetical protein
MLMTIIQLDQLIEKAIRERQRAARRSLARFDKAERKLAKLRIQRVKLYDIERPKS